MYIIVTQNETRSNMKIMPCCWMLKCCQHLSEMSSAVNRRLDYHVEVEEKMHGNILQCIAS